MMQIGTPAPARTTRDLTQFGDLGRKDLEQYCGVTAEELQTIFGAEHSDVVACRQGRLTTIARTDTTTTQANYDAHTGRYNVDYWV